MGTSHTINLRITMDARCFQPSIKPQTHPFPSRVRRTVVSDPGAQMGWSIDRLFHNVANLF